MPETQPKTSEQSNAEFLALSPEEQRVAIARDVIKQVEAQRYLARQGEYFKLSLVETELDSAEAVCAVGDLQRLINLDQAACTVCGLGACFASAVRLSDAVRVETNNVNDDSEDLHVCFGCFNSCFDNKLEAFFSDRQIGMIECAFEMDDSFDREPVGEDPTLTEDDEDFWSNPWARKSVKFGQQYDDAAERLYAIMENIVNNNGTFAP